VQAKLNIALFASGKGSNFKAILEAIEAGTIRNTEIVLVVSNNSDSGALTIAREHGIPALHVSAAQFGSEKEFCKRLVLELNNHQASLIVLAGYMKKIDPVIIRQFRNRIVNIHPALLPGFGGRGMYGMNVHRAVLASGAVNSGATVHIVDEEYDRGRVLLQKSVPVLPDDTPETLAARVLAVEHELYPEAIRLIAEGQLALDVEQPASSTSR
jgi:phosphoribosylglycinamide formyltransferase-1